MSSKNQKSVEYGNPTHKKGPVNAAQESSVVHRRWKSVGRRKFERPQLFFLVRKLKLRSFVDDQATNTTYTQNFSNAQKIDYRYCQDWLRGVDKEKKAEKGDGRESEEGSVQSTVPPP